MNLREKQNLTKKLLANEVERKIKSDKTLLANGKFSVEKSHTLWDCCLYQQNKRDDILIHPIFPPEALWFPRREKNRGL